MISHSPVPQATSRELQFSPGSRKSITNATPNEKRVPRSAGIPHRLPRWDILTQLPRTQPHPANFDQGRVPSVHEDSERPKRDPKAISELSN